MGPPSMEFSRQEYWSRLPFPFPGDLPNPGIERGSPALQADDFIIWATREAQLSLYPELMTQFSSVTHLCPTLWDPMDCSTPGLPVHHQLLEFTQTHVHWVGDAIQQSHPLSFPSPAPNPSQHQGLFQWVSPSHQVAKVLEFLASTSVPPMNTQD